MQKITVLLDQQREEALEMLTWYGNACAYLDQRVGRWSFLCKGKARQKITDLDLLLANAGAINEAFQDLVFCREPSKTEWSEIGCSVNHSSGLEFIAA